MKSKITCHWLQTNWPEIICSSETELDSPSQRELIRTHLSACPQCRAEIGSYFLPELREPEPLPRDPHGSILAGRVLERLGIYAASENSCEIRLTVPPNRTKLVKTRAVFPGIQPLLINFVTTAVIILTLTYTGYFNLLPQLETGVKILSEQMGTSIQRTQNEGGAGLKAIWTGLERALKGAINFENN